MESKPLSDQISLKAKRIAQAGCLLLWNSICFCQITSCFSALLKTMLSGKVNQLLRE